MAYKTEILIQSAAQEIEKKKLFFVEDVISLLPCSKPTFYDHFPDDSDELNYIKEKLDANKIDIKVSIRQKLHKGDNTTSLLALYKLICTEDERRSLSQSYIDQKINHSGEVTSLELIKASESSAGQD